MRNFPTTFQKDLIMSNKWRHWYWVGMLPGYIFMAIGLFYDNGQQITSGILVATSIGAAWTGIMRMVLGWMEHNSLALQEEIEGFKVRLNKLEG